jgi:enterobacterial common antigen flippase
LTTSDSSPPKHSYGQILKSSALIGGSSAINIAIGIVRTKAMALLLGPSGVGLMGLYGSIADLATSISGMGVQSSGVRQIAASAGSGEDRRTSETAFVLRRTAMVLGIVGAALLFTLQRPVAALTFGTEDRASDVGLLALVVLFASISGGQIALIQGKRRVADLARISVTGSLLGLVAAVGLVYSLGENGITPALVGVAAMTLLASWWYSRRVETQRVSMTASQIGREARALLKLGVAFMASGLFTLGAAYAIRLIITRKIGVEAAGLYQSAWTLGGLYVGFVLQSMGADFYPRLTAAAHDDAECNRLVNEQAQISLLLAAPGIIGTLTFAPLVIELFYSAKFGGAVPIVRWFCLGMLLRVVAWPMGFIVLAKGWQTIFFWTELAATLVQVGLAFFLVPVFGPTGAGAAFFGLYVWHSALIYLIVRRLTGFRWSSANRRLAALLLPMAGAVAAALFLVPHWLTTTLCACASVGIGILSLRTLFELVPDRVTPAIRRWLARFHLVPASKSQSD